MKTLLKLLFIFLAVVVSGCVDIFDQTDTLVFGYTDMPWSLRTKATTESGGTLDLNYMSVAIMGSREWEDVDHIILLDLSNGAQGTVFSPTTNSEIFSSLCHKHGDTAQSPVGCFRQITMSDPSIFHFYQDFTAIEVTSEEDFNSDHPAGSSLLDIIHYATDTPFRVLKNNYQTEFKDNSLIVCVSDDNKYLSEFYGDAPIYRQLFNTFKKGTDVTPEDLTILGNIYISFDKTPDIISPKHIKIQMTAENGEVYNFETVLTFERIN